ncbi:MAG: hypothetical protein F6K19_18175 [Cyanothece sp. SIO1E1]|nr:hypothetical protein [Cyanothece sp. SIO1E1]
MLNKRVTISFIQMWGVPLLLTMVALRQITLAYGVGLSSWHGGGFGMFASIDRDERRLIEVQAVDHQGQLLKIDLTPPNSLFSETELILIRTIPRRLFLQQVAERLLQANLQASEIEGIYHLQAAQARSVSDLQSMRLQQVQVQVWRLRHDRQTSRIWYEPVSQLVEATR